MFLILAQNTLGVRHLLFFCLEYMYLNTKSLGTAVLRGREVDKVFDKKKLTRYLISLL